MEKIKLDENNRCLSANCVYNPEDKVIDYEFSSDDEKEKVFSDIRNYVYKEGKLVYEKLEVKEVTLEETIKDTINTLVLSALPEGESLTKENAPTLVDIIKPENQGDKPEDGKLGDINNPIVIVDNDIAHNGYLYTYGLYYSYGGKKYKCERGGAPATQGSIKLYYTPDQLIGHYFVTV